MLDWALKRRKTTSLMLLTRSSILSFNSGALMSLYAPIATPVAVTSGPIMGTSTGPSRGMAAISRLMKLVRMSANVIAGNFVASMIAISTTFLPIL